MGYENNSTVEVTKAMKVLALAKEQEAHQLANGWSYKKLSKHNAKILTKDE